MKWTITNIRRTLGGKLIGDLKMRQNVCQTILLLPNDTIDYVCRRVWFVSSPEDAWAITFKGSELTNRHLIFLSDELFEERDAQIRYTILHEIGHVMLNHRNSIGVEQTQSEIKRQEIEADQFAKKFL